MAMYACANRGRYHGTKLAQYRVSTPQLVFAILVLQKGGALTVLYGINHGQLVYMSAIDLLMFGSVFVIYISVECSALGKYHK